MSAETEQKEQMVAAENPAVAETALAEPEQVPVTPEPALVASGNELAAVNDPSAQINAQTTSVSDVAVSGVANDAPVVTPVRSAKDAINAMYAQEGNKRLSTYLAASAKEIINANNRTGGNSKSAANLHRGKISHQIESVQPSAAGLIKSTQTERIIIAEDHSDAMDPLARKTAPASPRRVVKPVTTGPAVVKTSLKLDPRKKSVKTPPRNVRTQSMRAVRPMMGTRKGTTNLEQLLAGQDIVVPTPSEDVTTTPAKPTTVRRPRSRAPQGLVQDIMRPAAPVASATAMNHVQTIQNAAAQTVAGRAKSKPTNRGPFDSIKRRFKPAPKGFAKTVPEMQAESYVGYSVDQANLSETSEIAVKTPKPPVEIYGLMDEEYKGKSAEGLGVVEDYKGGLTEQKVAQGSGTGKAPDNNKYSIKGQLPLFLKSVNVEKRPLSEGLPRRKDTVSDGTLYAQPSTEAISNKNVYEAKPKESKKAAIPAKPTVIIPASRRSKAPLICLLILTVILGAAMGAFIYLMFFQYLD